MASRSGFGRADDSMPKSFAPGQLQSCHSRGVNGVERDPVC
jgi:hypothetical protein